MRSRPRRACFVGHDWGALIASVAATLAPERVARLGDVLEIRTEPATAHAPVLCGRQRHFLAR